MTAAGRAGAGPIVPRATYRLQLHRDFDFGAATAVLPYLQRLGISHVYCSPITAAQPGSVHGYDVTDPTRINPELGGRAGFEQFARAARALGLGLLIDQVPNHLGIAGANNAYWLDVLRYGEASPHAQWFDIDWNSPLQGLRGKVLVAALAKPYGEALAQGDLRVVSDADAETWLASGEDQRHPLAPRSLHLILRDAPELQALAQRGASLQGREAQCAFQDALSRTLADDAAARAAWHACIAQINQPGHRDRLHALHEAQCYRLASARSAQDDINYRRFFDVNDLAALRMEDERVFEATQALALDLAAAGWVDGLRIDHPDGLLDPAQYFERLQSGHARRIGLTPEAAGKRPLYVVAEKIEAFDERLPDDWAVHGTTGYRYAALVDGLLIERRHAQRMTRVWSSALGLTRAPDCATVERDAKRLIARSALGAILSSLARELHDIACSDPRTRDHGLESLRDALAEVAAALPVYRTYVDARQPATAQDRRWVDMAVQRCAERSHAADAPLLAFVRDALLGVAVAGADADLAARVTSWAMRFQQYSAPVAARGVEDTAFYRYLRLAGLNEVGADPGRFGISADTFHAANQTRARETPDTMLASSTHDNKRAEDVRYRLAALSEQPGPWRLGVRRWLVAIRPWVTTIGGEPAPSRNEQFLLLQTLLGTLPATGLTSATLPDYRERIVQYMLKAAREAKVRTTWADPSPPHEDALRALVHGVLAERADSPLLRAVQAAARELAWYGALNALSATVIRYTVPGVPDLYQGTEVTDLSLVDPDNRRPVDFGARSDQLAALDAEATGTGAVSWDAVAPHLTEGRCKLWAITRLLALRRAFPDWFRSADYLPLRVSGARRRHAVAYARRGVDGTLVVVVARKYVGLAPVPGEWPPRLAAWGDTVLEPLPEWNGRFDGVDALTGTRLALETGPLQVAALLARAPVAAYWIGTASA